MVRYAFLTTPKNYDFLIFLPIDKYRDISNHLLGASLWAQKLKKYQFFVVSKQRLDKKIAMCIVGPKHKISRIIAQSQ
jgi:hypothetical protein